MEQPASGMTGFREVGQHGHPVPAEPDAPGGGSWPQKARGHGINPFIAVLWTLSLALMAGGAWVLTAGIMNQGRINGPAPALSFLVLSYAPQAIVAGLATAVGLLFWHACQWQRRRS